jgi:hypothetical protein
MVVACLVTLSLLAASFALMSIGLTSLGTPLG